MINLKDYQIRYYDWSTNTMTDPKNTEPKPAAEWYFTAKPDFARICRDLAESGASVGRVSTKGSGPVTLVRSGSAANQARTRTRLFASYVTGAEDWFVLSGDHVAALLEPPPTPVRVEAFAVRPAPVAPALGFSYGIFTKGGERSSSYPQTFKSRGAAEYLVSTINQLKRDFNGYHVRTL